MLSFKSFIIEMAGYNLDEKYAHFNATLFGSKLPHIPIRWSRQLRHGLSGRTIAKAENWGFGSRICGSPIPGTIQMEISDVLKKSETQLDGILVHEMIHVFFLNAGDGRENHGSKFMQMRNELNRKLPFEIPLTDIADELDVNNDVRSSNIGIIFRQDPIRGDSASYFGNAAWSKFKDRTIEATTSRKHEPGVTYSWYYGKSNLHRKYGTNKPYVITYYKVTPAEAKTIQQMLLIHTVSS